MPIDKYFDPSPVMNVCTFGASPFLLVSDHAGNAIPCRLGDMGLSAEDLDDHIALDIGIFATCNWLAQRLDAHYIAQAYCRLVIDCNRQPGVPTSMPEVSDGRAVVGSQNLSAAERERRVSEIFLPYHEAIGKALDARTIAGRKTVLCAMHSFTRHMADGVARPWDIGVIHGPSSEVGDIFFGALADGEFCVGRNKPYGVDYDNDYTIPVHGDHRHIRSIGIEICQDLINHDSGQRRCAAVLETAFRTVADRLGF